MFVSQGCCDLTTNWRWGELETTETCSLAVVGGQKSEIKVLREGEPLLFFQLLAAGRPSLVSLGLWPRPSNCHLCPHMALPVSVSVPSSRKGTREDLGSFLAQKALSRIPALKTSAKTLFHIRSHSEVGVTWS